MKILLVRTSALGDVVHALPVLRALRRHRPEARVAWVVEQTFAPILADLPDLEAVFPVRLRAWRGRGVWSHRDELRGALREIRAFGADIAFDLMGNHKGGALARWSGARRVIGAARSFRREPESALWIGEAVATPSPHAVDRGLDLLRALDIETRGEAVDFGREHLLRRPPSRDRALLEAFQALPRPRVLIQAGAGWVNKTYPPERWGAVARRLAAASATVVVPTAPGEVGLARRLSAASTGPDGQPTARLVDGTDFATFAALCRHADLLLGGDTGPMHLAHALGTPVLALHGPTDPVRHGPHGAPAHALIHRLPCSFCHKRFDAAKACLLALTPERVAARALERLASARADRG
ncbi:MAG: glycosyltransferase family 9 protein [Acidobacteriota bacterium]